MECFEPGIVELYFYDSSIISAEEATIEHIYSFKSEDEIV